MSTAEPIQLTRDILTKAIKSKVERMPLRDLVDLASALKIAVPMAAKTIGWREPKLVAPPAAPGGRVLQGAGIGPVVSVAKGGRLLDAITVDDKAADWVESELIGAGAVVKRLSIARGTLDNWRKAGKVVALRKGVRNFVYPLRQFDHRRPVDGLDLVAEHFTSAEEAWEWLVVPNRMTGGKAPIDALRAGDVKNVVSAAAAAFDYA